MKAELLPLHTYVEGDAYCTVMMANLDQTFTEFAEGAAELVRGFRVEIAEGAPLSVIHNGKVLDGNQTVRLSGLMPFERVDIRPA